MFIVSNDDYVFLCDKESNELIFKNDCFTCRYCYIYDNYKNVIASDKIPIFKGIVMLREKSAFYIYKGRFSLVLIPEVSSDDIPF